MVFLDEPQNPPLEDLAHYGVKGMHWGVRKGRTGDIAIATKALDRVAKGKGTALDKVAAVGHTPTLRTGNLLRKGGLANEAARKSKDLKAQSRRLATGKAKVSDVLKAYGTVSLTSVVRSMKG